MDYKQRTAQNTLRIGARELEQLVNKIDAMTDDDANPERQFVRWSFRMISVNLTIEGIGGSCVTIPVVTRNISRGGISALHSSYVYPESRCTVAFTLENGREVEVGGRVVRCSHLGGKVHEIGVEFEEQLNTREMLGLDPMHEAYSLEYVKPEQLVGTVLLVTENEFDQQVLLQFIEPTQLVTRVASTIEQALERAHKGCDLILTDLHLGDECGIKLVGDCREQGIEIPILVMTSDARTATRDEIRMAGASGYFAKPIDQKRLYRALAEFMLSDGAGGPMHTTLDPSSPAFELLDSFYANMPKVVIALENSLRDGDIEGCRSCCRTLVGTATPLGFAALGDSAMRADRALTQGKTMRDAASAIRSLIIACRRVRVKPAA